MGFFGKIKKLGRGSEKSDKKAPLITQEEIERQEAERKAAEEEQKRKEEAEAEAERQQELDNFAAQTVEEVSKSFDANVGKGDVANIGSDDTNTNDTDADEILAELNDANEAKERQINQGMTDSQGQEEDKQEDDEDEDVYANLSQFEDEYTPDVEKSDSNRRSTRRLSDFFRSEGSNLSSRNGDEVSRGDYSAISGFIRRYFKKSHDDETMDDTSRFSTSTGTHHPATSDGFLIDTIEAIEDRFKSKAPRVILVITLLFASLITAGVLGLVKAIALLFPSVKVHAYSVAFIGNSYFFVNDLPRLVEVMGEGNLRQNSVIHVSGSLASITETGNGMYYKWQTDAALMTISDSDDDIDDYDADNANGDDEDADADADAAEGGDDNVNYDNGYEQTTYDFGACTIRQLLFGSDPDLEYGNSNNIYTNDGLNPCFEDNEYFDYTQNGGVEAGWDYVVMTDPSRRLAVEDARYESFYTLSQVFVDDLKQSRATPVLIQPHAFWSENVNMTGFVDVPTFTSLIDRGTKDYQKFFSKRLGRRKKPLIAPVGLAFLTVWEDDNALWQKLFLNDMIHPSLFGNFLYACTVYATIAGEMPPRESLVLNDTSVLWENARKLYVTDSGYPNGYYAEVLYNIAEAVTLDGYIPDSFEETPDNYWYDKWIKENEEYLNSQGDDFYGDNY